jgi:glycosyltransferase involved in cell wall biosynthesis
MSRARPGIRSDLAVGTPLLHPDRNPPMPFPSPTGRSPRPPLRHPRLLYLAFYFPPTRASGVYRSRATANFLAAAGWDVTVMTPQREFFTDYIRSYDPTLEADVSPAVRVERVHFPGRAWEPDIRRYSAFRAHFPLLSNRVNKWLEERFFPETYSPWIPRVVARARQLHRERPFDVVLATGNPFSSFAAAWLLRRLLGLPYVLDYRDSWTLNLFTNAPAFPPRHPAWRWERRLLADAGRIVFVNEPLRQWHQQRYPAAAERMLVVQNGFDAARIEESEQAEAAHAAARAPEAAGARATRPLRLGYLGTVTPHVPLKEFFAGWRLARADPSLEGAQVHIYGHLGFFPGAVTNLLAGLPLDEGIGVHYEGPVAKADVAGVYDDLDVLLLILAGSHYVTSGKVYEYMATGKPIVSVHDPASAASEVLAGYPLWFPVPDLSPESIRDALLKAAAEARSLTPELVAACRRHAGAYTREAQLAPFERELRKLVGG